MNNALLTLIASITLAIASCGNPKLYSSQPLSNAKEAVTEASKGIADAATKVDTEAKAITDNAQQAKAAPTTQAAQPFLATIINKAQGLLATATQLRQTQAKVDQLATTLDAVQSQVTALQTSTDKQALQLKEAKEEATKWHDKYEGQWLAGKSWRLIGWIAGITIGLVLLDVLLYIFVGVGINPISLLFRLVGKVVHGKTMAGTFPRQGE